MLKVIVNVDKKHHNVGENLLKQTKNIKNFVNKVKAPKYHFKHLRVNLVAVAKQRKSCIF